MIFVFFFVQCLRVVSFTHTQKKDGCGYFFIIVLPLNSSQRIPTLPCLSPFGVLYRSLPTFPVIWYKWKQLCPDIHDFISLSTLASYTYTSPSDTILIHLSVRDFFVCTLTKTLLCLILIPLLVTPIIFCRCSDLLLFLLYLLALSCSLYRK